MGSSTVLLVTAVSLNVLVECMETLPVLCMCADKVNNNSCHAAYMYASMVA